AGCGLKVHAPVISALYCQMKMAPRVPPVERDHASGDLRAAFDRGLARWGRLTNMKRTLLHSLPSYRVLMEWYTLFDVVKGFLGERLAIIFAHAISAESD